MAAPNPSGPQVKGNIMSKQAKGNKTGKVWLTAMSGINLKTVAIKAAETLQVNEDTVKLLRATAAQAFLDCGRACAKTGNIESVNQVAHWYAVARLEAGIAESTVNKEASQLRGICRACLGGQKVVKKLEENDTLYTHEFAALAKKLTPAKFLTKRRGNPAGSRVKTAVTAKEFAKMVKWSRLCTEKQRLIIVAIFHKVDEAEAVAAAKEAGKVVTLQPKATRTLKRKAA